MRGCIDSTHFLWMRFFWSYTTQGVTRKKTTSTQIPFTQRSCKTAATKHCFQYCPTFQLFYLLMRWSTKIKMLVTLLVWSYSPKNVIMKNLDNCRSFLSRNRLFHHSNAISEKYTVNIVESYTVFKQTYFCCCSIFPLCYSPGWLFTVCADVFLMVHLLFSGSKSWRVYGRNAEEVKSALLAAHPGLTVVLNPEKPRRNSFEITLLNGGKGKEVE